MKTDNKKVLGMIAEMKILFCYKTSKKTVKQIYTVNINKPVIIGGMSEQGYELSFYPENSKSNSVITHLDCLRLLHGDVIKNGDNTTMYFIN